MYATDDSSNARQLAADLGRDMHTLLREVYPFCRSITGPGVRDTLRSLQRYVPLEIVEVPTGTPVFDWQVPQEWRIRDAYIKDPAGRRIIDFRASNLHVVSYSLPVRAKMSRAALLPHLHSLPEHPQWIPYRTSYYHPHWGFCLPHEQLVALTDQEYEVCIDAELIDGSLSYGEVYLPGETADEVLFSCHVCHPSLASDNVSSVVVATFLAQYLARQPQRYSYRFLFAPGTIGAITWLAGHEHQLGRIRHGLVLALLGAPGRVTYKKSRRGNAEIDRAVACVLAHGGHEFSICDFDPLGYDERQYGSPGIDLPVGCLMGNSPHQVREYHSSADNCDFVRPEALAGAWFRCAAIVEVLEGNATYRNTSPKGEPQLGRRGLYATLGGQGSMTKPALLWVLNLSDGRHSLLDIAERAGLGFQPVRQAADALLQCGLLAPIDLGPEHRP